jgi:hypothetical protein
MKIDPLKQPCNCNELLCRILHNRNRFTDKLFSVLLPERIGLCGDKRNLFIISPLSISPSVMPLLPIRILSYN